MHKQSDRPGLGSSTTEDLTWPNLPLSTRTIPKIF